MWAPRGRRRNETMMNGAIMTTQSRVAQASNDGPTATPGRGAPHVVRRAGRFVVAALGGLIAAAAAAALALGALGPISYSFDAAAHLRPQFALVALLGAGLLALGGAARAAAAAMAAGFLGLAGLGGAWLPLEPAAPACRLGALTVATANVHGPNEDFDAVVRALIAADVDILATQESASGFWAASGPLQARYPHRLTNFADGSRTDSVMLWSKRPLAARAIEEPGETLPGLAAAEIAVAGRDVLIVGVHLSRPILAPQQAQISGLGAVAASGPPLRIGLGDFNLAPWSHGARVTEAALGASIAPGLRVTWRGDYPTPLRDWKVPALIGNQIDHVLTSDGLAVRAIDTFDLPGSVHRGVKATLDVVGDDC